jgi:hypothetical protein
MPSHRSLTAKRALERQAAAESRNRNSHLETLIGIVVVFLLVLSGCGKEGPPLPPQIKVAERTTDLTAFQEGDEAVLQWSYPDATTAGQSLTDIEEIHIWRAALPLDQEPPPPISPQDRQMRRQLLEGQGELLRALTPDEIAAATRGPALVVRDDLASWRQMVDDPNSYVLWYGVRTVCCRKRESELSNVVRLEPQSPPEPPTDLSLQAGADGIDISWTPPVDTKTLVERSADGAVWTAVTDEAVAGGSWRDTSAAQGQAWNFRLRSVITLEGGGVVVGRPSDPARVEHPDTYPPNAPVDVVCLPEGARVRVRWQSVAGAVVYGISRRHGDHESVVLTDEHRSIEFTDQTPPLGELTYLVTARDAAGNRSESASCVVVMGAEP